MSYGEAQLGRLFQVKNGGTPTGEPENWDGEICWVTPEDLGANKSLTIGKSRRTLSLRGLQSAATLVPEGSIVISTRAPIGHLALANRKLAFNQGCKDLVPRPGVDSRFFYWQLSSRSADLRAAGQGSTFVELSATGLAATRVAVPPLADQFAIAEFLDRETQRIDALIERKQRLLGLSVERRASVVERVLREAPNRGVVRFRYLCRQLHVGVVVQPAQLYASEGIPFLRGVNVEAGRIVLEDLRYLNPNRAHEVAKSRLRAGDLVVVRTGEAGAAALVPANLDGANCVDLLIVRPGPELTSRFAEHLINSRLVQRQVTQGVTGSLQAHFNVAALRDVRVPRVDVDEQERLSRCLDDLTERFDRAGATLQRQINLLRERRQALITEVVTGQRRSDAPTPVVA